VTPSYPPSVPSLPPGAPTPAIDPGAVIEHGQSFLQQAAPYFKWAAVGLVILVAAGLAWHWWQQHQKTKPGPAVT
jgi:hypothetical protein